jgi:hypothetical protein
MFYDIPLFINSEDKLFRKILYSKKDSIVTDQSSLVRCLESSREGFIILSSNDRNLPKNDKDIENNSIVTGYCFLTHVNFGKTLYISSIYSNNDENKNALLKKIINYAISDDVIFIQGVVHTVAELQLYRKLGFTYEVKFKEDGNISSFHVVIDLNKI